MSKAPIHQNQHIAYLSVGSNLGNKLENCRNGIASLTRSVDIRLIEQSSIYRTEPVDYQDQDWFVNYAVKIETVLDPLSLLNIIKSIDATRSINEVVNEHIELINQILWKKY